MTTSDYLTQLQQDREDLVDNLETQGITGLTGDETFTELVPEVLNIQGGADLSEYFITTITGGENIASKLIKKLPSNLEIASYVTSIGALFRDCIHLTEIPLLNTSNITNMSATFNNCTSLTTIPLINTSNVLYMANMFTGCASLTSIPLIDTSNAQEMSAMFSGCTNLTTLPALNIPKATNLNSIFKNCYKLNNTSLDNILQMCISATSYNGTKTLYYLFGNTNMASYYPSATIQALPHYQDFIDAGWQIGY